MSPKWITVLVVAPVTIIILATLLIIRSTYPPPKVTIDSTPQDLPATRLIEATPVAAESPAQPQQPSIVQRVSKWITPEPAKHSITGYSWLNQNGGASNIQRGLHIELLPATVPIRVVNETLELGAVALDKEYEREKKNAEDLAKYSFEPSSSPDLSLANTLYRDPAANLRANESKQTGIYNTDDAYKFIGKLPDAPPFIHAANAIKLQEVKTDVSGKYAINDVVDGDYFLYACINTPALFAEWVVPVTVKGADVSITLDNDNASAIHN